MADEEKLENASQENLEPSKKENLKKDKPEKLSKADKKAKKQREKERAQKQKEWEEEIVTNKRVKREELRKKVKRAMLFILIFAMIVTSVVYTTLMFVQENNVRITATSRDQEKAISLSSDNELWTPYLNAKGPEFMKDISYNPDHGEEYVLKIEDVRELLENPNPEVGFKEKEGYISFMFMLRNESKTAANILAEMYLTYNDKGLEKSVRVLLGTSTRTAASLDASDEDYPSTLDTNINIYAMTSDNNKLAQLNSQKIDDENYRTREEGYLEYVSYPIGRDDIIKDGENEFDSLNEYEEYLDDTNMWDVAQNKGYFVAEPFYSDDYVFRIGYDENGDLDINNALYIEKGAVMYIYVQIWIEGSDFDCVDAVREGTCKMGINFTVV